MTSLPEIQPDTDYALANPKSDTALVGDASGPPHAQLHAAVNAAVQSIDDRLEILESNVRSITADNGAIQRARMAAHEWLIRGTLNADGKLLMPLMWNLTGRAVKFEAAKATVLGAADADIVTDIVIGGALSGPNYDTNTQSSILNTPLTIPAGAYFSPTTTTFIGDHPADTYIAAVITQVGSATLPGTDLTIQLNRLL